MEEKNDIEKISKEISDRIKSEYEKETVKLLRKDAECMARILQSVIFKPEHAPFFACNFCTYSKECTGDPENMNIDNLRKNLQDATGAYLGFAKPLDGSHWTISEVRKDDGMKRQNLIEMTFVFQKEEALKEGNIEKIINKIETELRNVKQNPQVKIIFK